jgi:hypothetical protein
VQDIRCLDQSYGVFYIDVSTNPIVFYIDVSTNHMVFYIMSHVSLGACLFDAGIMLL